MTLLKLAKSDAELLARFCAECSIQLRTYTVEVNDSLILCEVETDNTSIIFSLGKMVGMSVMHDEWKKDYQV